MIYKCRYHTPQGFSDILMASDGKVLTKLLFEDFCAVEEQTACRIEKTLPVFRETCRWLDIYFSGREPDYTPAYRLENLTPFRKKVIDAILAIPFGSLVTYGSIANSLAEAEHGKKVSAQAVGGAVGWNPLCLIIPCHRVIGANNALTGYGGGIQNKIALLALEGHDVRRFSVPKA